MNKKNSLKTVVITTARMGSSRLPGKVLMPIADKCSLKWIYDRVQYSLFTDGMIIATTGNPKDNVIIDFCAENNIPCYRGSEENVMLRTIEAAHMMGADVIIEVTGDCPLVDPHHIDHVIRYLFEHDYEYVSNGVISRWLPDGMDVAAYYTTTLEKAYMMKDKIIEHQGWNIGSKPKDFRVGTWIPDGDCYYPLWRLTLDTKEDLIVLDHIFNAFSMRKKPFTAEEVIDYIKENPHLLEINSSIIKK